MNRYFTQTAALYLLSSIMCTCCSDSKKPSFIVTLWAFILCSEFIVRTPVQGKRIHLLNHLSIRVCLDRRRDCCIFGNFNGTISVSLFYCFTVC